MEVKSILNILQEIKQEIANDYPNLTITNDQVLQIMLIKTLMEWKVRR